MKTLLIVNSVNLRRIFGAHNNILCRSLSADPVTNCRWRMRRYRRHQRWQVAGPAARVGSGRPGRRSRRGTSRRSGPKREAVRNYQFAPCGGTPAYFFRNARVRQPPRPVGRKAAAKRSLPGRFDLKIGRRLSMRCGGLLRALLMVALPYFTLSGQPVLGLAAGGVSALQVELVGAAPDLVVDVDGEQILPGLRLEDFELPGCRGHSGFRPGFGGRRFRPNYFHVRCARRIADSGLFFTISLAA